MSLLDLLSSLFTDYTLRTVALGSATLGILSGALGTYAVLRKQSLLGDAISHAALPGIALAFLLTGSKAPLVLIAGAVAAGWIGTLLVMSIPAVSISCGGIIKIDEEYFNCSEQRPDGICPEGLHCA